MTFFGALHLVRLWHFSSFPATQHSGSFRSEADIDEPHLG
jgi:hypothetical protein